MEDMSQYVRLNQAWLNHPIHRISNHIRSKLELWKQHLQRNTLTHFPHLQEQNVTYSQKYVQYIDILIDEFKICFIVHLISHFLLLLCKYRNFFFKKIIIIKNDK